MPCQQFCVYILVTLKIAVLLMFEFHSEERRDAVLLLVLQLKFRKTPLALAS
jgi:hypothetical protein